MWGLPGPVSCTGRWTHPLCHQGNLKCDHSFPWHLNQKFPSFPAVCEVLINSFRQALLSASTSFSIKLESIFFMTLLMQKTHLKLAYIEKEMCTCVCVRVWVCVCVRERERGRGIYCLTWMKIQVTGNFQVKLDPGLHIMLSRPGPFPVLGQLCSTQWWGSTIFSWRSLEDSGFIFKSPCQGDMPPQFIVSQQSSRRTFCWPNQWSGGEDTLLWQLMKGRSYPCLSISWRLQPTTHTGDKEWLDTSTTLRTSKNIKHNFLLP